MDVVAVYQSATEAVARARRGEGPTLLECKTYRYSGHSRSDAGGYRSKEEIQCWRERDAILRCRELLVTDYEQSEQDLERIEQECQAEVEAAVEFAQSSLDPEPEACFEHIYAEREVSA
jgi:TPP-dependent pyruvate/acetoin dehydrogenase alpha subunit